MTPAEKSAAESRLRDEHALAVSPDGGGVAGAVASVSATTGLAEARGLGMASAGVNGRGEGLGAERSGVEVGAAEAA